MTDRDARSPGEAAKALIDECNHHAAHLRTLDLYDTHAAAAVLRKAADALEKAYTEIARLEAVIGVENTIALLERTEPAGAALRCERVHCDVPGGCGTCAGVVALDVLQDDVDWLLEAIRDAEASAEQHERDGLAEKAALWREQQTALTRIFSALDKSDVLASRGAGGEKTA